MPTFGRPSRATRRGPPTSSLATAETSGSTVMTWSSRSATPRPCSGRDRVAARRARGSRARPPRVAARVVGLVRDQDDRASCVRAQHPARRARRWRWRRPLTSTTNSTASARSTATSACAATEALMPLASGSQPPVSTTREAAAVPLGLVADAVAGDAGGVLDDGLAAAEDAVDERATCRRSGGRRSPAPAAPAGSRCRRCPLRRPRGCSRSSSSRS